MDNLIQGILTYSKVDAGEDFNEMINFNDIVATVISIIHIPANITVSIENELPIMEIDRFRIQQLFQNLISNAVNHSDKKVGLIKISVVENKNHYTFAVSDNGVGIDVKYQPRIFELFQSFSDKPKATGIGLSIVKRIVDFYNGTIWLESQLGTGTTFFIKLPKKLKQS